MFVDSDDYMPTYAVEYLYELLTKYQADASIGKLEMTKDLNSKGNVSCKTIITSNLLSDLADFKIDYNSLSGAFDQGCNSFIMIDTPLPPCMPFPRALTGFPVSSTAKVMYCRMLDAMLSKGQEDENGILFVCFPVTAIAAVLSRSPMTVKRSLNELETAGLIMRVRQGVGEPNRIYMRLFPGRSSQMPSSRCFVISAFMWVPFC